MILKKIKLVNYRNLVKQEVIFSNNINIFIGDNAQGKTNLLESIYFLALTKSYRTNDNNLINKDSLSLKIKGDIRDSNIFKNLSVELSDESKKVRINNNEVGKISDYITNLNVILVCPEDINILQGTPQERRNFLNIELSQISKNYIKKLNEFNKILKIRNNYLKMCYGNLNTDNRYLDSLTENLIEREIDIYQERNNFINLINESVSSIYKDIIGISNFKVIYETNIEFDNFESDYLKNKLTQKYKEVLNKEIENGMTLYGPHRDDIKFLIGEDDIKIYGSQGQQKVAIISLKLSEIPIFKSITGSNPIILLDDVFSELDMKTRNKLIKYISEDIQVIITTNDTKGLNKKFIDSAKVFNVIKGKIVEKESDDNGK